MTDRVRQAILTQGRYLAREGASPERIDSWMEGLFDLFDAISAFPRSYPPVDSLPGELAFEARRAIYGQHLVTFLIDETAHCVIVTTFRHGKQDSEQ